MKLRDSGMPEQDHWETLMDVPSVLDRFAFDSTTGAVAELGCGYGTFTIPIATRTGTTVHAFDIDPSMVEKTRERARSAGLVTVNAVVRDVFESGFGLADASCGACLLFNILHTEAPVAMLREAARVVRPGGCVAVIHWRSDIPTPRGPALHIRPHPDTIATWAMRAGGLAWQEAPFLLPPWHFGMRLTRTHEPRLTATG
ncbi:hypothetical protein ASA1KI_17380 [Opitutales bacterium ASA1]|uniref:class I SAM-dependent methyltransferase n=1 Tax=Congregicoccus parvus TaxID=3081749 RepID=UPI002B2A4259|nr:hypothetical protein ASA1KI_17380 [Opitutales bacterium ASA1]